MPHPRRGPSQRQGPSQARRRAPAPTRTGGAASGGASASAATGRHRRPPSPSRLVLVAVLAVLVLLLGSGTAISLTAGPAQTRPGGPELTALGAAPAAAAPGAEAPSRAANPAAESPEPEPEPDPPDDPEPDPDPDPDPTEPVDEITALEDEVAALTNDERARAGCGELRIDERLRTAARGHSEDMAANDYFDHTGLDGRSPFDRMRDAGYPDPAGENIAAGFQTPAEVMAGWMDSDGHRENLLSCSHQAVGVGLAYDRDGRPYWTQDFGR